MEKLRGWTDCDGAVESVFTRDELLTWITAYWVSGAIRHLLHGLRRDRDQSDGTHRRASGVHDFSKDLVNAPREFAERFFDVRSWSEEPADGHFAAWECPPEYAGRVRTAVALAGT